MPPSADRHQRSGYRSACFLVGLLLPSAALAQERSVQFRPSIDAQLTWTNNVDVRAGAERRGDFVTEIAPALSIDVRRPRLEINGTVAATAVLYAGESGESYVQPQANLFGRLEAIENFFFVESTVAIAPQYFDVFGARPVGRTTITDNRYTGASYSLSPYISGTFPNNIRYTLRNDNIWGAATSTPVGTGDVYTNRTTGSVERDPTPFGWRLEIDSARYD
ncbi:MAG TPA: TIGR03016 family PEP-CTERM system-associated outer membrane protein, partial [Casimicrobiaceae bacterium]|nr:TIGR03016 family PEP-CTERM system-associated outer membrane protein [Casimicrobiaceae bacterium]